MVRTQLAAVIIKEVRQTVRDKRIMFMLLVAPMVQLIVFGFAVNFDVDRVPAVVVDQSRTSASREHLSRLLADGTLVESVQAADVAEAERAIDTGDASAALIFEPAFARDALAGRTASVQMLVDGSDPQRANIAAAAATRYFGKASADAVRARVQSAGLTMPGRVDVRPRVAYNPRLRTAVYMVPGIAAMLLLVVTTIVTAMGLARERELGTLEQLLVTPIQPWVIMIGKTVPFVVIGLLDVALALTTGAYLFDVPLRANLVFLGMSTGLYLMSTLGMGLFISTVSGSQQQAFMGGFLFMLPAILLSGNLTPIAGMPDWLKPLTYVNPVRYYIEILRAALLKGAGLHDLWPQVLALAIFGTLIITVASLRFRKRLA